MRRRRQASALEQLDTRELEAYFREEYALLNPDSFDYPGLLDSPRAVLFRAEDSVYFGLINGEKLDGQGVLVHWDGRVCEGVWADGRREGPGAEIYSSGNFYSGNYHNNKKHGLGTFYWLQGVTSEPEMELRMPVNFP
jgi:hypothetical protein